MESFNNLFKFSYTIKIAQMQSIDSKKYYSKNVIFRIDKFHIIILGQTITSLAWYFLKKDVIRLGSICLIIIFFGKIKERGRCVVHKAFIGTIPIYFIANIQFCANHKYFMKF